MDAERTRQALLLHHEQIRNRLARCVEVAHRVRSGDCDQVEFDCLLTDLRHMIEEHNHLETQDVRGLLAVHPTAGHALVDRMLEEHLAEHAAFWEWLVGGSFEVARHMDDLADELDAHMAAEERTFLSPAVLRAPSAGRTA